MGHVVVCGDAVVAAETKTTPCRTVLYAGGQRFVIQEFEDGGLNSRGAAAQRMLQLAWELEKCDKAY